LLYQQYQHQQQQQAMAYQHHASLNGSAMFAQKPL
jgi:hypothetical protein